MKKYEIYQVGKLPPLTVIEADDYILEPDRLIFRKKIGTIFGDDVTPLKVKIAIFNWNNIAGFKEVSNDE